MFCTNCGYKLPDDVAACPSCGQAILGRVEPVVVEEPVAVEESVVVKEPVAVVVDAPVAVVEESTAPVETVFVEANSQSVKKTPEDKGGFLWGLLGCCIPVVGLVLFFVMKKDQPKTAKASIIGALLGVLAVVVSVVIMYVAMILFLGSSMAYM